MRRSLAVCACTLALGCQLFRGETRKGATSTCKSDYDCLYGLVCRGADPAKVEGRRCVYEQYSACTATRQCYPGRICRDGFCEVQCVIDSDCRKAGPDGGRDEDASCVVGECQSASGSTSCSSAAHCAFDEACIDGHCAPRDSEAHPQ
jgi:hypothetical protein